MPSGMPPRPDNAARTHRPRGPSGVARGCEALLYPEKHRVFRMILAHYLLRVDGKRDDGYRGSMPQIAKALDVDQATVSRVIDKVMQNRTTAETHKPLPELPDLFAGTEDDG